MGRPRTDGVEPRFDEKTGDICLNCTAPSCDTGYCKLIEQRQRTLSEQRLHRKQISAHERYERRKESGLCVRCGKPNDQIPKVRCASCEAEQKLYKRRTGKVDRKVQMQREWAAAGLCHKCGKRPPMEGRAVCKECQEKQHAYYLKKRAEMAV